MDYDENKVTIFNIAKELYEITKSYIIFRRMVRKYRTREFDESKFLNDDLLMLYKYHDKFSNCSTLSIRKYFKEYNLVLSYFEKVYMKNLIHSTNLMCLILNNLDISTNILFTDDIISNDEIKNYFYLGQRLYIILYVTKYSIDIDDFKLNIHRLIFDENIVGEKFYFVKDYLDSIKDGDLDE